MYAVPKNKHNMVYFRRVVGNYTGPGVLANFDYIPTRSRVKIGGHIRANKFPQLFPQAILKCIHLGQIISSHLLGHSSDPLG